MGPFAIGRAANALRQKFADLLGASLGCPVNMVVTKTYPELFTQIREDLVHVAWLPPAVFLQATDEIGVSLLLTTVRRGEARYHGVIFVPEESRKNHPEDLLGCTMGWVDRQSCGGFLFPRLGLIEYGLNPNEHFLQEYLFGSHTAVVAAVAAGKVDAGATYMSMPREGETPLNTGWTDAGLDLDGMRPILRSRPIPSDVIVASRRLGLEKEQRATKALQSLNETEAGRDVLQGLLQAERLEPAQIRDYDVVRAAQNVAFSRIRPTFPRRSRP